MNFNRLSPAELERLAILGEELGESQQAIGKILRHGYESTNPDAITHENEYPERNRWALEKELGDVMYAIRSMCEARDLNASAIEQRATKKAEKIKKYLHHQPAKQALSASSCCGGVGCNSCEPQGRG